MMWLVFLVFLFGFFLDGRLIDGMDLVHGYCRDAGKSQPFQLRPPKLTLCSIVEYATREQAQNAIQTLSNQSLMGRLVYVREVGPPATIWSVNH